MDIKNDGFFDEVTEPKMDENAATPPEFPTGSSDPISVELPLPKEDFDKNGNVKPLRGRILKKLLKREIKYFLPIILGLAALAFTVGLVLAFQIRAELKSDGADGGNFLWLLLVSGSLYVYSIVALSLFSQIYPVYRYNKNFFKNEGYLTFSIPASAAEHVFAKRIAAFLCQFIAGATIIASVLITVLICGGIDTLGVIFKEFGVIVSKIYAEKTGQGVLLTIELLLLAIVGVPMNACVYGAGSCFLSRYTDRKKLGVTILIVFVVMGIVQSVVSSAISTFITPFLFFPAGLHIALWIMIVAQAAVTFFCVFYEIHFLQKKLDLK
jgi:hypothetical protein